MKRATQKHVQVQLVDLKVLNENENGEKNTDPNMQISTSLEPHLKKKRQI